MFRVYCFLCVLYLLWILTTKISSLKFLTTWTIISQCVYFISEFHWNMKIPRIFQNLTWTPSVFITVYWPLAYILKWKSVHSSITDDLLIHGVNIFMVIVACIWKPKLEYKLVWIPFVFSSAYVIFAVVFTHFGNKIYPTNFFDDNFKILLDAGVVFVIGPIVHTFGVCVTKRTDRTKDLYLPLVENGSIHSYFKKSVS